MGNFRPAIADPGARALREIAARITGALNGAIWLEISPLLEENWTGIPVVAAGLARALLEAVPDQIRFFLGTDEIRPEPVIEALDRATGLFLHYECHSGLGKRGPLQRDPAGKTTIGIYPSTKSSRRVFDIECNIIHDLSTLITPQYHAPENITQHSEFLLQDIASNDFTVCVSEATAADLVAYLGITRERIVVAMNGVSWRAADRERAESECDFSAVEPYFLILGTREPRKNLKLIIQLLHDFPELLHSHRFVFTGRLGWLQESQEIPGSLAEAIDSGRIHFTGFISDAEKCRLLMAAEASIYPSLFEGFGLPVIESLSLGTPCIASCSASIPEAGGDCCQYFDPYSVLSLYRAIAAFRARRGARGAEFRAECRRSVAHFTWPGAALAILTAVEAALTGPGERRMGAV